MQKRSSKSRGSSKFEDYDTKKRIEMYTRDIEQIQEALRIAKMRSEAIFMRNIGGIRFDNLRPRGTNLDWIAKQKVNFAKQQARTCIRNN